MLRSSLLLALLLAGCSKGPVADLPAIGEARSLVAEWALVNAQAADSQLTATYAQTMRRQIREQLSATLSTIQQPQSDYARQIRTVLKQPDDAEPGDLRASADSLKQIEDKLESA